MTSDSLVTLLGAQSCQIAAVVAVVAITSRTIAHRRPHLAHTLWLVVVLKCVTPPIWASPSGLFCWLRTSAAEQAGGSTFSPHGAGRDGVNHEGERQSGVTHDLQDTQRHVRLSPLSAGETGLSIRTDSEPPPHSIQTWSTSRLGYGCVITWLTGIGIASFTATARWLLFLRRLRRAPRFEVDWVAGCVTRLSGELRLRRRVRVLVTETRIGPAVVGLFRPTILLPALLVRGATEAELEPILAHELVHIRRGDLWLCVAQLLTKSLWWFHPLVWWANRRLGDEVERCCDEEVVASLGYEPARYARSLLEVLQQKQWIQAAPAFPGVRPLDVTSLRLERIMRLGQGSHRRTPWWCWACMLLAAAILLPGGAFVAEGRERRRAKQPASAPSTTRDAAATLDAGAGGATRAAPSRSQRSEPQVTRTYKIDDVIERLQRDHSITEAAARVMLQGHLEVATSPRGVLPPYSQSVLALPVTSEGGEGRVDRSVANSDKPTFVAPASAVSDDPDGVQVAGQGAEQSSSSFQFQLDRLVVSQGDSVHARIPEVLSQVRKHGLRQIMIRLRIISLESKDLDKLTAVGQSVEIAPSQGQGAQLLEATQAKKWLDAVQSHPRANVIQAPQVITYSGRAASIRSGAEFPFVVGYAQRVGENGEQHWESQTRVVEEGTTIHLLPELCDEGQVKLEFRIELNQIKSVKKRFVVTSATELPKTIQVPEVNSIRVESKVLIPADKSLLLTGLESKGGDGKTRSLLVMIDCQDGGREAPDSSRVITKAYSVADLVTPVPSSSKLSFDARDSQTDLATREPQGHIANYETLASLIKTTILPDSWRGEPGEWALEPYPANLSLVVRASEEAHREIASLFKQLRQLQDIQVALELQMLRAPDDQLLQRLGGEFQWDAPGEDDASPSMGRLSESQRKTLLAAFGKAPYYQEDPPKVTVFNGRSVAVHLPFHGLVSGKSAAQGIWLTLAPTASQDRRSVKLDVALGWDDAADLLRTLRSRRVTAGESVLIDLTDNVALARFMTGIPLIRQVPDVKQVLKGRAPATSKERYWVVVTPRVIVQEGEEQFSAIPAEPKN